MTTPDITTRLRESELLPCPFCGGEASDTGHIRFSRPLDDTTWADGSPVTEAFSVNCISCGAVSRTGVVGGYQTKAEAVSAWNRRAPAWQPIETAPKDGTIIDVWRDGSRETVYWGFRPHECGEMGQYCDSDWHNEKTPGWVCSTFGEFVGGKHDPFTHWKPIPAGPTPSQIEEGKDNG